MLQNTNISEEGYDTMKTLLKAMYNFEYLTLIFSTN